MALDSCWEESEEKEPALSARGNLLYPIRYNAQQQDYSFKKDNSTTSKQS